MASISRYRSSLSSPVGTESMNRCWKGEAKGCALRFAPDDRLTLKIMTMTGREDL
jgi:hypothetical protein